MGLTTLVKTLDFPLVSSLLRSCGKTQSLDNGRLVHNHILECGFQRNTYLANCLMDMYGNCGSVKDARAVFHKISNPTLYSWNILIKILGQIGDLLEAKLAFDRIPCPDVVSWTAMSAAYVQNGYVKEGLETLHLMMQEDIRPDNITYLCAVDAYAHLAILDEGHKIHFAIADSGYEQDVTLANALINMYGKCGSPCHARNVFEKMPRRDVVSWNTIIGALAQNLQGKESLHLFRRMQFEGVWPNEVSFICVLDACSSLSDLEQGEWFHSIIIKGGYDKFLFLGNALVSMYAKFGHLCEAISILHKLPQRNTAAWNAIIAAAAQNDDDKEALDLFYQMQHKHVQPNDVTFICVINACTNLTLVLEGQRMHHAILDCGCEHCTAVGNSLVKMYGKCCSADEARSVFHKMMGKDIISWNAMVTVLAQNGHDEESLELFHFMLGGGVQPDKVTLSSAADSCASLAMLEKGREVHTTVVDSGCEHDLVVANSLLDMYGKCGDLHDAMAMFGRMVHRDVVSWTATIDMFVQTGHTLEAFDMFIQMQVEGIEPNQVTFICILNTCSHIGWVSYAQHFFAYMKREYGILVTGDHLVCMVDILGRAGQLEEAEAVIKEMHCNEIAMAWLCLLGACIIHRDLERGERAACYCFELDPKNVSSFVLLSNLYATSRMWDVGKWRTSSEGDYDMDEVLAAL